MRRSSKAAKNVAKNIQVSHLERNMARKMKLKKIISIGMVALLLAVAVMGCGNDTNNTTLDGAAAPIDKQEESKHTAMGRYVEQTVELPQLSEEKEENIFGMIDSKDGKILYTFEKKSKVYNTWYHQTDQTWVKEESVWLNDIMRSGKNIFLREIKMSQREEIYAWYMDDGYQAHIVKTSDEKTWEEVAIQDLLDIANLPNGFAVTGDGDIAVSYMGGEMMGYIVLYKGTEGSELRRFKAGDIPSDNISNMLDAKDNKLVTVSEEDGLVVYDTNTGEIVDEFSVDLTEDYMYGMVKIGADNDYYYLNPQGLHHLQSGGSIIETLIDGSLNSLGIVGMSYLSFLIGDAQDYEILLGDGNSYELNHYIYDATVAAIPEIQLTVYGLTENASVSRAIGTFQKENTDVQIVYYTAQSEEGAVTIGDSIRSLNTELLSGKGADILLLDGLPVESYMEKGVLADISDVVKHMAESGELIANVIKGYEDDKDGVFGVPVRFGMPVLVGDKDVNTAFQSMASLRQYAETHPDEKFISEPWRTIAYEELAAFFFNIYYMELMGTNNQLSKEKLVEFLETIKETGTTIGATVKPEPIPPATQQDIANWIENKAKYVESGIGVELGAYAIEGKRTQGSEIKGVMDMMAPITIQTEYGRNISSENSMFIPYGIIGVNQSCKQMEKAKDFVRCILSEQEQNRDMGAGMPVNLNALENMCNKTMDISIGTSYRDENGKEVMLGFEWPTREEIASITDLAKTLTKPMNADRVLKEMILSESKLFFEGSITAEKAAEAILTKANTYLAE